jgi:hypothetical protein
MSEKDPLFGLDPVQVQKPIEIYKSPEIPDIHYLTETDDAIALESREDEGWVQALLEEGQIWGRSAWDK